jgi:hypothetical protein
MNLLLKERAHMSLLNVDSIMPPTTWTPRDLTDAGRRYATTTFNATEHLKDAKIPGTVYPGTEKPFSINDINEFITYEPLNSHVQIPLPESLPNLEGASTEETELTARYNHLQTEIDSLRSWDENAAEKLWKWRYEQHLIRTDLKYGVMGSPEKDTSSSVSSTERRATETGGTKASIADNDDNSTIE